MNPPADNPADPQRIRVQINETRHRMDETIDALGRRLRGRHLVDEALHLLRTKTEKANMTRITHKLRDSADTALHSVADAVKTNPIPATLIGAGVAWYIYSQSQRSQESGIYSYDDPSRDYNDGTNGGTHSGEPDGIGEKLRDKAGELRERSRETVSSARERLHTVGERVGEMGTQVRERSQDLLRQGRQRVSTAFNQHPLETGIVCLALGLIAGLSLPTSRRVRQTIAPHARQLRERTRKLVESGRNVARTAAHAAIDEAEAQGLTPRALSGKVSQVAKKAGDAAQENGHEENNMQSAENTTRP